MKKVFHSTKTGVTSRKAAGEGPLFQDGQRCSKCCMYRVDRKGGKLTKKRLKGKQTRGIEDVRRRAKEVETTADV